MSQKQMIKIKQYKRGSEDHIVKAGVCVLYRVLIKILEDTKYIKSSRASTNKNQIIQLKNGQRS